MLQQAKLPAHGAESHRPLGEVGGLQLEDHGDVQLDIDSGEGAEVAPRVPLVAEVKSEAVPMGREGGEAAWEVGNQIKARFSDTM